MHQPLLLSEKINNDKLSSQNLVKDLGLATLQKYKIKNEVRKHVKLTLTHNEEFLEENVQGVRYNIVKPSIQHIWNTNTDSEIDDVKKIFNGKRTPYYEIISEINFISSGQVIENEDIIFIGCKDGTIRFFDLKNKKKSAFLFVPHQHKEIQHMQGMNGFLVTQSIEQQLIIWDIRKYNKAGDIIPEQIQCIEKVHCFELKQVNEENVLSYQREHYFERCILHQGQIKENGTIDLGNIFCQLLYTCEDSSILISDMNDNVYRLTLNENKILTQQLLREKQLNNKVKGLHFHYDIVSVKDNQEMLTSIVTIVISNEQDKNTILQTINLHLLEKEEDETRRKEEERKKKKEQEEEKKKMMGEDEFKLWKLQQQQIDAVDQTHQEQSTTESNCEEKETAVRQEILDIGECQGICLSSSKKELLISGQEYFLILSGKRWTNKLFDIRTEFQLLKAIFDYDEKYICALGQDGILRIIDWKHYEYSNISYLKETDIQDAVGTKDGYYFAVLSQNQNRLNLYSYTDCSLVESFHHNLEYTYLMNFSADSSALVCVQGNKQPRVFNIVLIKIGANFGEKVVSIPNLRITEDYITQIDASLTKKEIYMISKSEKSSSLHIYGFDRKCKRTIRGVTSLSVSSDEKILAYTNQSNKLHMIFIKEQQAYYYAQLLKQKAQKKSIGFGFTKQNSTIGIIEDADDEKTMNTINLFDTAMNIEFYDNNMKIAVQAASSIIGYDVYTHEIQFKIQTSNSKLPLRKMRILYDQFLTFTDVAQRVQVYDLHYNLKSDYYLNMATQPLKRMMLNVNSEVQIEHTAWANCGNHIILQMKDQLLFQASPFNHHKIGNDLVHSNIFENIDGLFVPILIGGPKLGSGTFAELYDSAIRKNHEDLVLLSTPIYPYKLNALHYFAITNNVVGAQACFQNKVKFMQDCFGKSPLDYAIKTKDKLIIEAIMQGIYDTETEERTRIMRSLPLSLLVDHPTSILANLLNQAGSTIPDESKFGDGLTIPTLFPINKLHFAESGHPIYSAEVAKVLHNPKLLKPKVRNRPILTLVLNNPIPRNFTDDSMKLLEAIVDCSNDDIVRSKPITLYLNRKWNGYAYKFYLFQFIMFVTLLMTLTGLNIYQQYDLIKWPCFVISISINSYFFMFELLQLAIQKTEYFQSFNNILDISRLTVIYMFQFSIFQTDIKIQLPEYVLPAVFMLMWFKILSYLSVFKPTRYLIKMIFEIINDITTFLIILFGALFAYAQISYVIYQDDIVKQLRDSYVLSFGELVGWDEIGNLQFILFIIFSFFIPLVLMNMLIALMADSYTRVQTNAVAADARALAEMEMEMEEVVQFILSIFRPSMIKEEFYYCFTTQVNDGEEEEDWEGTVGQLKRTIEEATENLQGVLLNQVEELTKRNTEKIIDNLLKANKQELDVIDAVNILVQKENSNMRQHIEEKMLDESHKMKEQFHTVTQKLEDQQKRVETEFQKTHDKIDNELIHIQDELKLTQQIMGTEYLNIKEQFDKTQEQIVKETTNMKMDIQKAQQDIQFESLQMQTQIKSVSEKVESESISMKDDLKKAQEMIIHVNSQVETTSSKIVENVQQSTNQTKETLIEKIEVINNDGTSKIKEQVDVQTTHHKQIVQFAIDTQHRVQDMITKQSDQQVKFFNIIIELLKQQQENSLTLDKINNIEQEIIQQEAERTQESNNQKVVDIDFQKIIQDDTLKKNVEENKTVIKEIEQPLIEYKIKKEVFNNKPQLQDLSIKTSSTQESTRKQSAPSLKNSPKSPINLQNEQQKSKFSKDYQMKTQLQKERRENSQTVQEEKKEFDEDCNFELKEEMRIVRKDLEQINKSSRSDSNSSKNDPSGKKKEKPKWT